MTLPNSIVSTQDLSLLILELRDYAKWFMHTSIKQKVDARTAPVPPVLTPTALELVSAISAKKLLTTDMIDALIEALERLQKTAPTITITLAAPATNDVKHALVGACRQHIAPDALVTFKFNSTLCGGMVVAYGSHVFDWSFRRQILANRANLTRELARV